MKKILSIAAVAAGMAAFAGTETVDGTTEVGMLPVTSSTQDTIVAVPFKELSDGENISVSNIVKTTNLTAGDQLYVYSGTRDGWEAWVLAENTVDSKTYLYWKSVGSASIDVSGNISCGTTAVASSVRIPTGGAVWLKRASVPSEAFTFYVYGKYQQALSTDVSADVMNLIANPLSTATAIPGTYQTGDRVLIPAADGKVTSYTYNSTKAGWVYYNDAHKPTLLTTLTLPAGQGCWYKPTYARVLTWRSE